MAVALTSGSMIMERNEGILERSLVNGISGTELLFSQIITQFVIMFGQTIMVLLVAFALFNLTQQGNWITVMALTVLAGVCGMCFGKNIYVLVKLKACLNFKLRIRAIWPSYPQTTIMLHCE